MSVRFGFLSILMWFISLSGNVVAQSTEIDSLRLALSNVSDSKDRVKLLNALSFRYFDYDVAKADTTTREALELAIKLKDRKGEGWATTYRGVFYFISGMMSEAETTFQRTLVLANELDDGDLRTHALVQLGNTMRDKGEFALAYQRYNEAKSSVTKSSSSYYRSSISMNLSRHFAIKEEMDSALHYALETEQYRLKLNDRLSLADAWMQIGKCYLGKDEVKKAEEYFNKANQVGGDDPILRADYLQNMGELYFRNGDFQKALHNWGEVLKHYRQFQYKYALANLLLRMGNAFETQGFYDLANEYLGNGIRIAENAPFYYLLGEFLHEQSWVYFRLANFDMALLTSRKAETLFNKVSHRSGLAECWDVQGLSLRDLKKYDSSLYYHTKSLAERRKLGNKVDISASLFNTGEFYTRVKQPDKALPFYQESLKIDRGLGDNYGTSLNLNRLGRFFQAKKNYDSAFSYFKRSMNLSVPISAMEIYRDNYIDLANYYEAVGNPSEALHYQRRYIQLSDSIFSKQTAQSVASYRTLYEVEQSEQKIELLNKDNELTKARLQRQQVLLYAIISGALVLIAIVIFYFRFARRLKRLNAELAEKHEEIQAQTEELQEANDALGALNRNIAEQKEEIQAQAEELTESNETISKINEDLEGRIEERTAELKQAFKELDTFFYRSSHDFRRPLTTFMGLAEVARVLVKDPAALELFEKVNENAQNLDKMLRKLQSFSDVGGQEVIYKEVLIQQLFDMELDKHHEVLQRRKIVAHVAVNLTETFYSYPALVKIIVENLVENSITFSNSTNPVIELSAYDRGEQVYVQVKDNGMGIDPLYHERVFEMYFRANDYSTGNGLGLYIVRKTAQKMGAKIMMESQPGVGTTITIVFPKKSN